MTVVWFLALLGVAVIATAVLLYASLRWKIRHRFKYVDLAEQVGVSEQWTEIPFDKPLVPKKQVQRIDLIIPGARLHADRKGTFLPDGTVVEAEVELKDETGKWNQLRPGVHTVSDHDSGTDTFTVGSTGFTVGTGGSFVAVRLRAHTSFTASRIRWVDHYMK